MLFLAFRLFEYRRQADLGQPVDIDNHWTIAYAAPMVGVNLGELE